MTILGAINKKTKEYVYPAIASKEDKYICPDCKKKLIFCHGKIKRPYFKHFVEKNPCTYYNKPSESQIHKDAKMLLKKLLETRDLTFTRDCSVCESKEQYDISKMSKGTIVKLEHVFEYNGKKIADVACIKDSEIKYIFEICHTHETDEKNRPEPWYEVNATKLIDAVNENKNLDKIKCIRNTCKQCIEFEKWLINISESDYFLKATEEWERIDVNYINVDNKCMCNKSEKNNKYMHNPITRKTIVVCSICSKRFNDYNEKIECYKIIKELEKRMNNGNFKVSDGIVKFDEPIDRIYKNINWFKEWLLDLSETEDIKNVLREWEVIYRLVGKEEKVCKCKDSSYKFFYAYNECRNRIIALCSKCADDISEPEIINGEDLIIDEMILNIKQNNFKVVDGEVEFNESIREKVKSHIDNKFNKYKKLLRIKFDTTNATFLRDTEEITELITHVKKLYKKHGLNYLKNIYLKMQEEINETLQSTMRINKKDIMKGLEENSKYYLCLKTKDDAMRLKKYIDELKSMGENYGFDYLVKEAERLELKSGLSFISDF